MAGHRPLQADGTRKPKRHGPAQHHRAAVRAAPTGEAQLAAACAWVRSAGARAGGSELHRLATLIAREADALEKEIAA
jgi:hypothetical protein